MKNWIKIYFVVIAFSIAMAMLEAAVVVYLRLLIYHQTGLPFPLQAVSNMVLATEFFREIATVIMIACIGYIAGNTSITRWAYFLISFATWDLFYYVFIKLILNWPATIIDWDILFLVPTPWYGPVLAPCLVALAMLGFGSLLNYYNAKLDTNALKIAPIEYTLQLLGCGIILFTFISPFLTAYYSQNSIKINHFSEVYIPSNYNWWLFINGYVVILISIVAFIKRNLKKT